MLELAGRGGPGHEGIRMGLWGAAQAIAFGVGGFAGAAASDLARLLIGSTGVAYSAVFAAEALLFVFSALLAITYVSAPTSLARPVDYRVAGMERG